MSLEKELAFYEQHRDELVRDHLDKFVLVKDSGLVGTYSSFEEAYTDAVKRFGVGPVLVKQVLNPEPVAEILGSVSL